MSHYAQLDENNVVVFVIHAKSNDKEDEFTESTGDVYRQTSYNTRGGVHYTDGEPSEDQSKAFRFNYAGIGHTYDADRDAFIPPQPYASWVLDEATCQWVAPIAYPAEGDHVWDEQAGDWVEVTDENS